MGWEIQPRGREWLVVGLVLSPVFLAAGLLVLFPALVPHGWRGWLLAYVVGVVVVVAAARSRRH
jgi:peptidoglycan/LPS O-acetylase OafA/YrhL